MIKSFSDKETAAVFAGYFVKRLPSELQQRAKEKLRMLDAATDINTLRVPPGNKLEQLVGNRHGQWSYGLTINGVYVSHGMRVTPTMLKSSITTREALIKSMHAARDDSTAEKTPRFGGIHRYRHLIHQQIH